MQELLALVGRAIVIGVGATIILDLWNVLLRAFGVASTNWGMVGRWIGHFPRGRFVHDSIAAAAPIPGEHAIGWIAHYVIGVMYALMLLAIVGMDWARAPTLLPALAFGLATIVAPFFIMQPGMGAGIAASRTPNPAAARVRSLFSHVSFAVGLYVGGWVARGLMS